MPANKAAYLPGVNARLELGDAPYTAPVPDQVVIKNCAAAVNPCDWIQQDTGLFITEWPYILGCDVAGTVEEVGSDVQYVKKGDRVLSMASAVYSTLEDGVPQMHRLAGGGGFQLYSVVRDVAISKLPDNVSFEQGSVIPLGFMTAASALYLPVYLNLPYPSVGAPKTNKYVFIWGGSSSVGSSGVQLALNSGFNVLTTCSAHNVSFCQSLGAEKAFDHRSPTLVDDVVKYLKGKELAGVFNSIADEDTLKKCVQIAQGSEGTAMIITIAPGNEQDYPDGVKIRSVMQHLRDRESLDRLVHEFLPKALENGAFKAKPDPLVLGKGLENAQKACDTLKAGVSASKVVIQL